MMKFSKITLIIHVVFSGIFVFSCGQFNIKDEGLDSKTIEEASGTSEGDSGSDNSTDNSSSSLPAFVVVGDSGAILTSSDGITWSNKSLLNGPSFTAITSGNDILLATGSTGVVTSTDGITWTSQNPGFTPEPHTLRFGKDLFLMTSSTDLYSSADGRTWTKRHTPSNVSHIMGISFTNDTFFVYSDNLSHSHTNPQSGTYFYGGTGGTLAKSSDGINWNDISWSLEPISKISYLNDRYVAVGGVANSCIEFVATSTSGTTWTQKIVSAVQCSVPEYLAYGNSTFLTVGGQRGGPEQGVILSSGNGDNWSSIRGVFGDPDNPFSELIFENNIFTSIYGYGSGEIAWTDNGSNWSQATLSGLGAGNTLKDLIHANNLMLAVGESGAILTSSDGKTWNGQSSGTSSNLNKAWGSGTMKD